MISSQLALANVYASGGTLGNPQGYTQINSVIHNVIYNFIHNHKLATTSHGADI
ncbi:hypothetical protein GCM10025859_31340 [Alicyclobacillus fastidiosus]|nr:hypothetical protein GCM10025859_31340 [Alicyclobacillus fastidiosus]